MEGRNQMADVLIAAAPEDEPQARGLAEALTALGFKAGVAAFEDASLGEAIDGAKCVLALWSKSAPPVALVAATTMAQERKKLVGAELSKDATPALLRSAPRTALNARDRNGFRKQFEALQAQISALAPATLNTEALPDALIKARSALLASRSQQRPLWQTAGGLALAVGVLFAVGFGAGRVINAARSGQVLIATAPAEATPTSAPTQTASSALTWRQLEREPWRTSAALIQADDALISRARSGDARAQALACLAHLAGVDGVLPSPTTARGFCDASAEQHEPAGLYLSWVLHRAAPHAGLDEATARGRLAEAARLGWSSAQIDYASLIAPDARAPLAQQAEAGRLWLAAAEAGDARGQFFYARWLRDSPAGPRDPTQAIPFLERAAEANHPEALHMLATLYRDGVGVSINAEQARRLYERAAALNHTPAMFNLADMLRANDRARAIGLYSQLACMRDERQIAPLAARRLRAMGESVACR
jgi:hypothetical protein